MNVYQRLNAAREEFHQLKLEKTGHNKFAGYNYFELGDFLIPAMAVFKKHGLCGTVSFGTDLARMTVVNVEKPDETITFESPMGSAALKGCHEVQNVGAVETYQRRYLWVAALEIVEHDALDATTGKGDVTPIRKARTGGVIGEVLDQFPPLTKEQEEYFGQLGWRVEDTFKNAGVIEAYNVIVAEHLESEDRIHLEAVLPSNVRSALKKEGERRRQAKKEAA